MRNVQIEYVKISKISLTTEKIPAIGERNLLAALIGAILICFINLQYHSTSVLN